MSEPAHFELPGRAATVRLSATWPVSPLAARSARRALAAVEPFASDDLLDVARLLVSELLSNCVRHIGATQDDVVDMQVELSDGRLHVAVRDQGPGLTPPPVMERPPVDAQDGRGLFIVNELATRWGVAHDHGSVVWFELVG